MPSANRIDSIYDVAAIAAEQAKVEALVRDSVEQIKAARSQNISFNVDTKTISDLNTKVAELEAALKKLQATTTAATQATVAHSQAIVQESKTLEENIKTRRELQGAITRQTKAQKENIELYKKGAITYTELNKRLTESQVKIEQSKVKIQELNRVIKEDIALSGKAGDAYKQLSAQYNKAALAAKNYTIQLGANHPKTIQAVSDAKALSDQLKAVDASVGQNQRNVGNYGSAIAGAFKSIWGGMRTAANLIPGLGIGGIVGGIATAIGTLVSAVANASTPFNKLARDMKIVSEVQKEATANSKAEIVTLDGLIAVARDETESRVNRNKAVTALQNMYPDYLKNISLETINSQAAQLAIDELKNSILQKAVAEAYADKIAAASIKNAEIKQKIQDREIKDLNNAIAFRNQMTEAQRKGDQATISALNKYGLANDQAKIDMHGLNEELEQSNSELELLQKNYTAAVSATLSLNKATKEKTVREKKEPKGRDLEEANRKAVFDALKATTEAQAAAQKAVLDNDQASYGERIAAFTKYIQERFDLINIEAYYEKGKKGATTKEILAIEEKAEADRIKLRLEANKIINDIEIKAMDARQKAIDDAQKEKEKDDANMRAISDEVLDGQIKKNETRIKTDVEKQKEADKKREELIKKRHEVEKQIAEEAQAFLFDIFESRIEKEKNLVQEQIDALEVQKQKDIEVANQTITNAQDKANAIAVIEARAQAKREQLEMRQRELDQKKARYEKARAVAEITQGTAIAVIGALGAKPWSPANIALAVAVGALGAIQIARTLAQPIPKYAEGTANHPGGAAIVGDAGRSEGIVLPDGTVYRTPATSTLVDLPRGAKVFPDYSTMPTFNVKAVDTTDELKRGFNQVVGAIKRIPQPIIRAERAWTAAHKIGSSYRTYLNRSI